MGITLSPAERAAVEERPTRDIAAFLAYSRGVRDEAVARFEQAAAEYTQAIQLDPDFAVAGQRLQRVRSLSRRGSSLARAGGRSRAHSGRLHGVIDGVNPSPASRLGRLRDHGQDNARAALESNTMATVILFINTLP
jgi:outer membrane receptor protein involved in Fe transport